MLKKASILACMLLLSVMLAACGGDDDEDPTATVAAPTATTEAAAGDDEEDEETATATEEVAEATATEEPATPTSEPTEAPDPTATTAATEPPATPTESTEGVPEPTADAEADATPEMVESDPVAEAALMDMVVTEEELPEGWTLFQVAPSVSEGGGLTFCNAESFSRPEERLAAVDAEFERDPLQGPFLLQSLTAYPEATATEAFEVSRDITSSCEEWTDEDGIAYQLSVEERPDYGDESYGLRMTFEAPGAGAVTADFTLVRIGGLLLALGHLGVGELDNEEFTTITETVVDKMEAAEYRP